MEADHPGLPGSASVTASPRRAPRVRPITAQSRCTLPPPPTVWRQGPSLSGWQVARAQNKAADFAIWRPAPHL